MRIDYEQNLRLLKQLESEHEEWSKKVRVTKSRIKTTEFDTQVLESTIGFEENRVLRQQLDNLHEEYNKIVD